jgi:hypothetical protein
MSFVANSVDPFSLPSLPLDSYRKFPDKPAIYFAILKEEILYIGKARSLFNRWSRGEHHRHGELQQYPGVKIAWIEFSEPELLLAIEEILIRHFSPKLNRHNVKKVKARKGKPGKKGGNPQNFNNPDKTYKGTLGARVAPYLFDYVNSKPDKTDWIREAIAEKYKREVALNQD